MHRPDICRFAPSTTGPAHPGTLLAALLCWLDAKSRQAQVVLRLEDLDPERCRPEWSTRIIDDLAWFGLYWDDVVQQHERATDHAAAMDQLEALGVLYPCSVGRSELAALGQRAPDGSWVYDNRSRGRALPVGGWRACDEPLRVRLPDDAITLRDESGDDLSQTPSRDLGDPVVRRRDGAFAYQLVVVVDDAAAGVTRVVRGRDLAASTATQVALQKLLNLPTPTYRHHFLLLENHRKKLAKLHGSVDLGQLRPHYDAARLRGKLAHFTGLRATAEPVTLSALLRDFSWERVRRDDLLIAWDGARLVSQESSR